MSHKQNPPLGSADSPYRRATTSELLILFEKINDILEKQELQDAERQLSSLRPCHVPAAVQMLVERVLLDNTLAPFVSNFLAWASSHDLVFTTDVKVGFRRALAGRHFDGEEMTPILSMLEAAGLNDELGSSILADGIVGETSEADDEPIDLNPLGVKEPSGHASPDGVPGVAGAIHNPPP
ncbi:hypothetical protein C8R44DRAFT_858708 [Mycena epipterygia]|nr:hypothetical protein C8R44DRAFT_858708 [Mycena epipterygia]